MNNQYIYKEGKAYVTKNFKDIEILDYYNGLEDVLKLENNIEFIEDRIKKIEKTITDKDNNLIFKYDRLLPVTVLPMASLLGFPIAGKIFGIDNVVNTPAFGEISIMNLFGSMSATFNFWIVLFPTVERYFDNKENRLVVKRSEKELEILKNSLIEFKKTILELQKDKKNDKEMNDFFIKNISFDSLQLLNDLNINDVNVLPKKRTRKK